MSSNEGEHDRDDDLSPTIVKVIDRIARTLIDAFNLSVDCIVKGMEQQLTHRIDVQAREIYDARKQSDKLEAAVRTLSSEVGTLKETINHFTNQCNVLEGSLDEMDQYSRNSNILIHGMTTENPAALSFRRRCCSNSMKPSRSS